MFFNKPIHDLTYNDVVAFCAHRLPENKQLDYKFMLPKNHEKFAKTIASFANALGGTIIVGVQDDKDDKPCPPFVGIPYHEKVRNAVESIIQTYIDPIVFVDINVCASPDRKKMFIVINIPQSNLTPHLVGKLKRAYIRTGQSSRPETIVHPNQLPWLLDHREKSERLRHILYDKAAKHFDNYLKTLNAGADGESVCTISLCPFYPQEPLTDYARLPEFIAHAATRASYGVMANPDYPLRSVQDGMTILSNARGVYKLTEFNAYGLLMNNHIASQEEMVNGHPARTIRLEKLAQNLILFLLTARKFLDQLSFTGALYFRLKITNTCALRALLHKNKATVLEDYIRIDQTVLPSELQSNLLSLAQTLLHKTAWALGLQTDADQIRKMAEKFLSEAE